MDFAALLSLSPLGLETFQREGGVWWAGGRAVGGTSDTQTTYLALDPDICPPSLPDGAAFDLTMGGYTMLGDTRTTTEETNLAASLRWSSIDPANAPDPSKGEDSQH